MNCDRIRPLLSLYVDGQAGLLDTARVEEHLQECEACRAEVFDLRQSAAALRRLPSGDPGPEFNAKVMAEYTKRSTRLKSTTSLHMRLAMGFACLLLLIAVAIPVYVAGMRHFAGRQDIYVIGADSLIPGSTASLRVVVANRDAEHPIRGSNVTLALASNGGFRRITLMEGRTDAAGTLRGSFTVPADIDGDWKLVATARSGLGTNSLSIPIELHRAAKVMLTTDKPVYQPGQVIHLRSLALLRPSLKPAGGDDIRFVIEDPKENKVFDQTVKSSEWGIASAEFRLGQEINLGRYTVRVILGDTETRRSVTVKRYVLPKFKVSLQTDRTYYLPGETIHGSISARYFFGKPAAGARVRVGLSALNVRFEPFAEVTGRTDSEGVFTFEAKVPGFLAGQPVAKGNALVKLAVTAVDTANHQEEIVCTVPVAKSPLVMAVVPESGDLVPNVENVVYVATSYPDGRPARTRVELDFEGVTKTAESDALGVSLFRIIPSEGETRLHVTARASGGEAASESFTFDAQLDSEWVDAWAYHGRGGPAVMNPNELDSVLIRPDKAIYNAGDTAHIVILSNKPSGSVYLDVVLDNQTVLTQTAHLKHGRAELALDLSDRETGTLTFSAYTLSPIGVPVRDTAMVLVRPASELNVEVRSGQGSYRPGERARIDVRVTDAQGKGVPAAVGVNVVDESVFSVEEQMPGLAALYFALQEDILKPRCQTKFVGPEEITRDAWRDPEGATRRLQQQMLRPRRSLPGILPGWNDPNALLSSDRPATIQRAARVLFASASGVGDPNVNAVMQEAADRQIAQIQGRFFGESGAGVLITLYIVSIVIALGASIVRRSRWSLTLTVAAVAIFALLMIVAFVGANGHQSALTDSLHRIALGLSVFMWIAMVVMVVCGRRQSGFDRGQAANVLIVLGIVALVVAVIFPIFARCGQRAYESSAASNVRECGAALGMYWDDYDATLPKPSGGSDGAVRVRQFFPETLYSDPAVITDDSGRASLDVPLADSITTWRVSALASSMNGEVGSANAPLRVFQEFFVDLDLPVSLTQGDAVSVPVAVYNHLPEARKITVALHGEPWFESGAEPTRVASLGPNEVGVVYFPIRAKRFGAHSLTVSADSGSFRDAVRREVTVHPNGQEQASVASGVIDGDTRVSVHIPSWAIPGASKLFVRVYPGVVSQVVGGLEGLLQVPYGCFEQTSSITYPNALVLKYLRATGRDRPEVAMKAEQLISTGYQRLLTFEVPGGGFDWYGEAPANTILTAYGVMELADMADVCTVDKRLIDRARALLERRQKSDGHWSLDEHSETWGSLRDGIVVTAYVTWALAEGGFGDTPAVERACSYLARHLGQAGDPYRLALVANALVAADRETDARARALTKLAESAHVRKNRASWHTQTQTLTYGCGGVAETETTALAAYAFLESRTHRDLAGQALNELMARKDSLGSWETTQATILSLKALVAGAADARGGSGSVEVTVNGMRSETIEMKGGGADVVHSIDVTDLACSGANRIELSAHGRARPAFQVVARYYVPWSMIPKPDRGDLSIDVRYGKLRVGRDGVVDVSATVRADHDAVAMAMVDLGLPPGFAVVSEDLEAMRSRGIIERVEVTPRQIILYLRDLDPGAPVRIGYRLRALYPVRVTTPASRAYDYYNPASRRSFSKPVVIESI